MFCEILSVTRSLLVRCIMPKGENVEASKDRGGSKKYYGIRLFDCCAVTTIIWFSSQHLIIIAIKVNTGSTFSPVSSPESRPKHFRARMEIHSDDLAKRYLLITKEAQQIRWALFIVHFSLE